MFKVTKLRFNNFNFVLNTLMELNFLLFTKIFCPYKRKKLDLSNMAQMYPLNKYQISKLRQNKIFFKYLVFINIGCT